MKIAWNHIKQTVDFIIVTVACPGVEIHVEDVANYFIKHNKYWKNIQDAFQK